MIYDWNLFYINDKTFKHQIWIFSKVFFKIKLIKSHLSLVKQIRESDYKLWISSLCLFFSRCFEWDYVHVSLLLGYWCSRWLSTGRWLVRHVASSIYSKMTSLADTLWEQYWQSTHRKERHQESFIKKWKKVKQIYKNIYELYTTRNTASTLSILITYFYLREFRKTV